MVVGALSAGGRRTTIAGVKPCPFCAEQIQDAAIKCRFCGSMLEERAPAAAAALAAPLAPAPGALSPAPGALAAAPGGARVLFEGAPSWKAWFWSYVAASVLSLVLVGLVWLGILHWKRKSLRYKITDRTIDYEAGLLTRRVETLQLWRVHDLDLRQTFMERLLDIAEIRVFTRDASDPELVIRGLPASRELFEALKNAAELARQQRVLGVVQ
ncbi:hypothetical protein SOCE836_014860 [Sorangium cellulosum]|uniref:YdbS-like PH domain-containing protein n=1 Tax=Sorangium cellulosum TaxID=56 RepID=A0A4P2QIC7_SORCE|nr:hypothetical protein SOCE836_014860 [Sorangium cellulosum]WCQ88791.1 membrane-flanked domain protein [Sorangium sp. Soce836]